MLRRAGPPSVANEVSPLARSLLHIPQRLFGAVFMTVMVGVVFFFAATRTQVGRNELRQELQRQFSERFAGSLHIGRLQGNLVSDLFASDVRLLDPSGQPILTIDSLVARPRWQTLFSQHLSFRSLTLIRPRLVLHRDADSTWNAQQALARREAGPRSLLRMPGLALADLRIRDGTMLTIRDGAPPALAEHDWLFDYTRARLDDVQAHVTIERSPQEELIDIFAFSASLPGQDLEIQQLQGQILGTEDRWTLNQISLRTDATRLTFDATLARFDRLDDLTSTPEMEFHLASSRIDFDEVRRVVPRWPLADAATVEAQIRGPLSRLVVESLRVEHEQSRLAAEGTVNGLPHGLDYALTVRESRISVGDIRTLVPSISLPPIENLGPVELSIDGRGFVPFNVDSLRLQATTELALRSRAGALDGELRLVQYANQPTDYAGQFRIDSLDVDPFVRAPIYRSRLTGTAHIAGRGLGRTTAHGRMDVALSPSTLVGRRIDSLRADLRADGGLIRSSLQLWQPREGYLEAEGDLDLLQTYPTYYLTASTRALDLHGLLDDLPSTRLNGRVTTRGTSFSLAEATGRLSVQLDSSSIDYRGQTHVIPPLRTDLLLADRRSSTPRIEVTGDVVALRVDGDVAFEPLWALGNLWGRSAMTALSRELDKPYNRPLAAAASPVPSAPVSSALTDRPAPEVIEQWRTRVRRALRVAGYASDLTVQATFTVQRSDVLEALLPLFPTLRTDLNGRIAVTAGADRFALQSHLRSTAFALQGASTEDLTIQLRASGNLHAPLAETFTAALYAHGTHAQAGPLALQMPRLTFDYADRQGILRFESDPNGDTGPFRLAATADLLPDRNELTVFDVHLEADGHHWTTAHPSTVNAYADALIIPDFLLESPHPANDRVQRLQVHGAFSTSPRDTVFTEASNVLLQPFSALADFKRPLGGELNGTVELTGGWNAPRVDSAVNVDWLSFDRRLLGRFHLASRYELGSPDVLVDATLAPVASATAPSDTAGSSGPPSYLPHRPSRSEENRLALSGRLHLPGRIAASTSHMASGPDFFDLELTVDRADLFFFEYIFEGEVDNVSGYLTGNSEIRGSLREPRFSADLQAVDGQFDMPEFNLHYDLEGPVSVDAEGIKLDDLAVHESDGGEATVSGAVLFNAYEYFSFDLRARLDEMRIIDVERSQDLPFYGSISASGLVALTGPLAGATLQTENARTTPDSELFIPVQEGDVDAGSGFLIFADSTGRIPDFRKVTRRENILADRPDGEPRFLDALDLDINLLAPQGSTVHLVFDPLLGDVVTAVGSGRIQIQRQEGEFYTYGTLEVNSGEYLFTAGEVFVRRFTIDGGTITWDGNPTNAQLDLNASYRTRASTVGLPGNPPKQRIPVIVQLDITSRVESPRVGLSLAVDARDRNASFVSEALQSLFNQPDLATNDRATEYATSVLLTNTFLLTTSSAANRRQTGTDTGNRLTNAGNQLAFNSVSQLVASQLNRYLSEALPNMDVNLGVQGEDPQDLDVIYGVALRLLDERLVIRGEGIYQGDESQRRRAEGLEGEFVVEVRLSQNVSAQAFYRRSGDELLNDQTLTSTTGAGLSYQTEFTTWRRFFSRLFDWFIPGSDDEPGDVPSDVAVASPDTLATDPQAQE